MRQPDRVQDYFSVGMEEATAARREHDEICFGDRGEGATGGSVAMFKGQLATKL
jgi:hypothetical protein